MAEYRRIGVRIDEDFLKLIDAWRRKQDDEAGNPLMHARIAMLKAFEPRQARSCNRTAPETSQSLQNCTITRSSMSAPGAKAEVVRDRTEVRV
jgi:hypothetical protein